MKRHSLETVALPSSLSASYAMEGATKPRSVPVSFSLMHGGDEASILFFFLFFFSFVLAPIQETGDVARGTGQGPFACVITHIIWV